MCKNNLGMLKLTIGSYVSVRSSRYEARGKFGEHERCGKTFRDAVNDLVLDWSQN